MQALSEDQIEAALQKVKEWSYNGSDIVKTYTLKNFAASVGFISAIAVLAETADHHPDILLHGWNKVDIMLSTHSAHGITEKDFALAQQIDSLGF
ncbi:MAG TPA: 4a-hydroxytetrahydrobiopterin dehydratase [Candidatus Kapabacteria bacterium]|nr:4a-hydroxytetrahydrobiopterin dehydratase [Candidatus Kapabacteria bacterium]